MRSAPRDEASRPQLGIVTSAASYAGGGYVATRGLGSGGFAGVAPGALEPPEPQASIPPHNISSPPKPDPNAGVVLAPRGGRGPARQVQNPRRIEPTSEPNADPSDLTGGMVNAAMPAPSQQARSAATLGGSCFCCSCTGSDVSTLQLGSQLLLKLSRLFFPSRSRVRRRKRAPPQWALLASLWQLELPLHSLWCAELSGLPRLSSAPDPTHIAPHADHLSSRGAALHAGCSGGDTRRACVGVCPRPHSRGRRLARAVASGRKPASAAGVPASLHRADAAASGPDRRRRSSCRAPETDPLLGATLVACHRSGEPFAQKARDGHAVRSSSRRCRGQVGATRAERAGRAGGAPGGPAAHPSAAVALRSNARRRCAAGSR